MTSVPARRSLSHPLPVSGIARRWRQGIRPVGMRANLDALEARAVSLRAESRLCAFDLGDCRRNVFHLSPHVVLNFRMKRISRAVRFMRMLCGSGTVSSEDTRSFLSQSSSPIIFISGLVRSKSDR